MALKPKIKRRIIWTVVCIAAAVLLCGVFVPPMVNLNSLKPRLQSVILRQTGVDARIDGDVNFSLLSGATIVAHNVVVPNGTISRVSFGVPLRSVFDLNNASLSRRVWVDGARVTVDSLAPVDFRHELDITNSTIRFLDKDYDIVRGTFSAGGFVGTVRTDQHKYDIEFTGGEFSVRNRNNRLLIDGWLYPDGSARGELHIDTQNVNRWFDFNEPKIEGDIELSMNFEWDGLYGFDFTNIRGDGFTGKITLYPDGRRYIKLSATDLDYDFSFMLSPMRIFFETTFDLDFRGDLRLGGMWFKHLAANAIGTRDRIQINRLVADDVALVGGYLDADGMHDVMITMPIDGVPASCLFTGSPEKWTCGTFTWGDVSGRIAVENDRLDASLSSPAPMPAANAIRANARRIASRGVVEFQFADAAGRMDLNADTEIVFKYAHNKTLRQMGVDLPFLRDDMRDAAGDFSWADGVMTFRPKSGVWRMAMGPNGTFQIAGDNFKQWFDGIDLRAIADLPYVISGEYSGGAISNLVVTIGDNRLAGRVVDGAVILRAGRLNLDTILSREFLDNYEEMAFFTTHPMLLPFDIGGNVSISADSVILDGVEYANPVCSLRDNVLTFSITDAQRGGMLATIKALRGEYKIDVQLSAFRIPGFVLGRAAPMNIRDTKLTAEIDLKTHGHIAHDIMHNMSGDVEMTFDGGVLYGLGIDRFYASADGITTLNAEYVIGAALDGGETQIKRMRVVGNYRDGVFNTTVPFTLSMRHADAAGALRIGNGDFAARMQIVLRGTSPDPTGIDLGVNSDGGREYSLSEIMRNFDAEYMRSFVKTHMKF